MAKLEVKAMKQENLFHEGKSRYYVQMTSGKKTVVINLGETTFRKVIDVINEETLGAAKVEEMKITSASDKLGKNEIKKQMVQRK